MSVTKELTAADFDHTSTIQMNDPYERYKKYRDQCPVGHTSSFGGFWYAANYDDVKTIGMDFATFSSADGTGIPKMPEPMFPIDLDPPQHTKFRKILNPRFQPEVVTKWRSMIEVEVNKLIDDCAARGEADFASELCRPLPPAVILPLLGIPLEDRKSLSEWIEDLTRLRATDLTKVQEIWVRIADYLKNVTERARHEAVEDSVLSDLLTAQIDGRLLSNDEIFRTLIILLFGGLDTATSVMLESLRYFSDFPSERERLMTNPEMWPTAIEELIRLASPVQGLRRRVSKDVELSGNAIHAGESVFMMFGSANRDEKKFSEPDKCLLHRSPNPHLSFGAGAHTCIGRHFARLEIEILLRIVFERLPDYRVREGFSPEYLVGETRGLKSLPVMFTPEPNKAC